MSNFYNNTEAAKKFGVSDVTIIKYIQESLAGKNNLEVEMVKNKARLLKTDNNDLQLLKLAEQGKKYRANINCKRITLDDNFYSLFSVPEIIALINDLETKRETKIKYSYKGEGAQIWDERYKSNISPVKKAANSLFNSCLDYFQQFFADKQINIVDVGAGNGRAVEFITQKLIESKSLSKYIAVDISESMSDLAIHNIQTLHPDLELVNYELDMEAEKFDELLIKNKLSTDNTANLILLLGNTICNIDDRVQTLKNIRSGMKKDDLLVVTIGLDSMVNRQKLDYVNDPIVYRLQTQPLRLLGIDIDLCKPSTKYDPVKAEKVKRLELDKDYDITFNLYGKDQTVRLYSGESIKIWKHSLLDIKNFIAELESTDLQCQTFKTDDEYTKALLVCKAV